LSLDDRPSARVAQYNFPNFESKKEGNIKKKIEWRRCPLHPRPIFCRETRRMWVWRKRNHPSEKLDSDLPIRERKPNQLCQFIQETTGLLSGETMQMANLGKKSGKLISMRKRNTIPSQITSRQAGWCKALVTEPAPSRRRGATKTKRIGVYFKRKYRWVTSSHPTRRGNAAQPRPKSDSKKKPVPPSVAKREEPRKKKRGREHSYERKRT